MLLKITPLLVVFAAILLVAMAAVGQEAPLQLPTETVNIGTLPDDGWHACRFTILNQSSGDLVFNRVVPSCASCTRVDGFSRVTPAGGEAFVEVSVRAGEKRGPLTFRLVAVAADRPIRELVVKGYRLGLALPQSDVYLGDVSPGGSTTRSFSVRSAGLGDVTIKVSGVGSSEFKVLPATKSAEILGESEAGDRVHTLTGTFAAQSGDLGPRTAKFTLSAHRAGGAEPLCSIDVIVRASLLPPVPANPPIVFLGAIHAEEVIERTVVFETIEGESLAVECDDPRLQVSLEQGQAKNTGSTMRVRYAAPSGAVGLLETSVRLRSVTTGAKQLIPVVGVHIEGTNADSGSTESRPVTCVPLPAVPPSAPVREVVQSLLEDADGLSGFIRVLLERAKSGAPPLTPVELGKAFMVGQDEGVLPRSDISESARSRLMDTWASTRAEGTIALAQLLTLFEARRDLVGSSDSSFIVDIENDPEVWLRALNVPDQVRSVREIARFAHADAFRQVERGRVFEDGERQTVVIASDGISRLIYPVPDGPAVLLAQESNAAFEAEDWALEAIGGLAGNLLRGTARAREYDLARFVATAGSQACAIEQGGEWMEGHWTIRLRIGFGHSFVAWLAPDLGFAPVHTEETYEQNSVVCKVTRSMRCFREVISGLYIPFKIVQHQNLVNDDGSLGGEYYRRTVTVEHYRPNCFSGSHPPDLLALVPPRVKVIDQRDERMEELQRSGSVQLKEREQ